MKCSNCGRENRTQAGFCAWCGEPLKPPKPDTEQHPPVSGQPDTVPEHIQTADQTRTPSSEAEPSAPDMEEEPSTEEQLAPTEEKVEARPEEGIPLRTGQVLFDRYEIIELVESGEDQRTYRAKDLCRCATCGYVDSAPGAEYCQECGAAMKTPCYVTIVERVEHLPEQYDLRFTKGEREYFVTAEPVPQEEETIEAEAESPPLRLAWGKATDQGLQRDHNEDYAETWVFTAGSGQLLGLFVVADGLGGQDSGEIASRMATEAIWQSLRAAVWEPIIRGEHLGTDSISARVVEGIKQANQTVYDARVPRNSTMSTTLTLALVVDKVAYVGNIGDSRTYLWNKSGLHRLTQDHSLVQRLVDAGEIAPEDVYSHPQRNLIYQSIGDHPKVDVDVRSHELAVDDHLILCSDGLWEMVRDEGIEEVLLSEPDPQRASDRLVQNANLAGGEDNITVIVVQALKA